MKFKTVFVYHPTIFCGNYVSARMCGFPLAKERKKQKTFFSHMAGSLGTGVGDISGHMACVRLQFLFCHLPLLDMPHPPVKYL